MKSKTLPSFWECYQSLPMDVKKAARKAYFLFRNHAFHPSLYFKCVDKVEEMWSLRITLHYRALGLMQEDAIVWFWIGNHDTYERLL